MSKSEKDLLNELFILEHSIGRALGLEAYELADYLEKYLSEVKESLAELGA